MQEIGTFHGGDLQGLTKKLDYLQQLGINVLWISSPLEQMHGWVGGGEKGDFPHYGYHGYYHQDWTKIDENMGSEEDLKTLIDQAHKRGIKVIFDVVMNHTGYATLADMQEFGFSSLYLKPEEINSVLGENGQIGHLNKVKTGTVLTIILTSATKPVGQHGGEKIGFVPTSAITTVRNLTT